MAALGGRVSIALIADADGNPIGFCTVYLDILSVRFGQCSCIEDLGWRLQWAGCSGSASDAESDPHLHRRAPGIVATVRRAGCGDSGVARSNGRHNPLQETGVRKAVDLGEADGIAVNRGLIPRPRTLQP
jgi:hypothetical protein